MPTPRHQLVIDAIKTRFAAITVANGYATNLGEKLFEWREMESFDSSELPAINLKDPQGETVQALSGVHDHKLTIWAELLWANRSNIAADVRLMIADVQKAIGVDRRWGGIARDTDPQGFEILVQQNSGAVNVGGCRFKFDVTYRTKSFDPYNA